ncbi:hypothetical protein TNCV_1447181 [Trichonephila clavipes]|nr:hypothetical protein TNCV_1447181 [Trichonephila clavipes]
MLIEIDDTTRYVPVEEEFCSSKGGNQGNDLSSYELKEISIATGAEVLEPEVIPFLQGISGVIFQQDNARPHAARNDRDFFSD